MAPNQQVLLESSGYIKHCNSKGQTVNYLLITSHVEVIGGHLPTEPPSTTFPYIETILIKLAFAYQLVL